MTATIFGIGQKLRFRDDFKPDHRLIKFLKDDSHFVNEIRSAFRAARFAVIGAAAVPDRKIWLEMWRACGVLGSFAETERIAAAK
jgi:hypothetical protein